MTLAELSRSYQASAAAIHRRLQELRGQLKAEGDPAAAERLRRRIGELTPLWREARDLALLTEHYYDRSFYRYEQYTL